MRTTHVRALTQDQVRCAVLREAELVHTREEGRQRMNSLNVVPIRQIYERWVSPFHAIWSSHLLRIKETAERERPRGKRGSSRKH